MSKPIAFVGQVDAEERAAWLGALSGALKGEEILEIEALSDAQCTEVEIAIVANPDPADLARLSSLKWVQSVWAGVENLIGLEVPVVRMVDPDLSGWMAEAVLAWSLYLHRDMPFYRVQQEARAWTPLDVVSAKDRTIGLLGLGKMGQAAADLLHGVGFNLVGWSRREKQVRHVQCFAGDDGLKLVLTQSDILVCLLPHTPQTTGLLDAENLGLLPPSASLINFGRGSLIIEAALIAALDRDDLSHAVLDVFDQEPLPRSSVFWKHPKITVLPHISAPTNISSASAIVAKNICAYRESGVIPDSVDQVTGY